ncbi:MAG: TlpA disulfide reductase family protein, partial [Bacteroidota bacterium]
VKVTGSPIHELDQQLSASVADLSQERDSVVQRFFALMGEGKQEELTAPGGPVERMQAIDKVVDSITMAFIHAHPNTYAGLINLGYQKEEFSKDSLRSLFAEYSPELQASRYGHLIQIHLDYEQPQQGDDIYDFAAEDTSGQTQQFSQLLDKYILLDFTGTYCGPCIESIPELKEVQTAHADQLKVLSFSTDAGKDTWMTGVRRDQIEWMSLWDGEGNYSETKLKYGVQGIPHFFLISPEGKMVAEVGGYGEGLVTNMVEKALVEGS